MYLHILYSIPSSPCLVLSASVSLSDVNFLPNLKNVSWLQIASELSVCGKIWSRLREFLFANFNHLARDERAYCCKYKCQTL